MLDLVLSMLASRRRAPLRRGVVEAVWILVLTAAVALAYNRARPVPLPLVTRGGGSSAAAVEAAPSPDGAASAGPIEPGPAEGSPAVRGPQEIAPEAAAAALQDGMTLLLDARDPEDYAAGHLPGAVNLPYNQFETQVVEVAARMFPEQRVICYCEGGDCELSHDLARELFAMGYTNTFVLAGGLQLWAEQGGEVVVP